MADFCKDHPRYSGKRQPQSACWRCWTLYFWGHPEEKPFVDATPLDNRMKESYTYRHG